MFACPDLILALQEDGASRTFCSVRTRWIGTFPYLPAKIQLLSRPPCWDLCFARHGDNTTRYPPLVKPLDVVELSDDSSGPAKNRHIQSTFDIHGRLFAILEEEVPPLVDPGRYPEFETATHFPTSGAFPARVDGDGPVFIHAWPDASLKNIGTFGGAAIDACVPMSP